MTPYHLSIVTPQGKFLEEDVECVVAPGVEGTFGILANHTPFVSLLKPGPLQIKRGGSEQNLTITQGILEVSPEHKVLILLDAHPQTS